MQCQLCGIVAKRWSATVPTDRAVSTSYKLSIVIMSKSAAVDRNFQWKVSSYNKVAFFRKRWEIRPWLLL